MLKRLRADHPILYCILAEVLFLGSLFLSSLVLTVALVAAGADFSGLDEYLLSLVQELVGASGWQSVFTEVPPLVPCPALTPTTMFLRFAVALYITAQPEFIAE